MRKCQRIKLGEIFNFDNTFNVGGIFCVLAKESSGQPEFPLVTDFINQNNYSVLDVDYHLGYSADKYLSPLAEKMFILALQDSGYTIEDFYSGEWMNDANNVITNFLYVNYPIVYILYERFAVKWKKIFDALINSTYNPLNNYDMEEKRTPDLSKTETFNDVTDTRTPDLETEDNSSAENLTGVYGFNGASAKNSATNDGTSNSTITTTGTDTNVKTGSITNTETGTDTLTRKGNIGVTSTQQLLEQEIEVRKHDFYRIIYNDIDSILCLKIY